jgi:hypothetical protein
MRLLHTSTFQLELFMPEQVPDYVILSHRWSAEEIVFSDFTFGDIMLPEHPARTKAGFRKVVGACSLAAQDQYEWIWIDSCCIDKSSSAILQESINSMWNYYSNANICYVYMADVPDEVAGWTTHFSESEWFNRGWTLQELIAPTLVEFYAENWSAIGTKLQRCDEIARKTYINPEVLRIPSLIDLESTANRMSWAAHRQVTRGEDQAYSLLGLFQVNMPMLYGEGRAKAFGRLQEAIYNTTRDDSLFLFRYSLYADSLPLLSDSPTRFCPRTKCQSCQSNGIECLQPDIKYGNITASRSWSVQAHEHLLTTITPSRFEASTTLLLLEKAAIPKNLLRAHDFELLQKASHLAILNHTLMQKPEGAFCLLLQRSSKSEDSAVRINEFPVLIRNWTKILSEAQKTKVLFALQHDTSPADYPITTEFMIRSESYYAYAWEAKNSTKLSIKGLESLGSTCSIHSTSLKEQPSEVLCYLSATFENNVKVVLALKRAETIWLVKDVAELNTNRRRGRKELIKYRSTKPEDRCNVRLANNKEILISVRRLAASRLAQTADHAAHVKTQIGIVSL